VGKTDYPEPRVEPTPAAIASSIEDLDVPWCNEIQPGHTIDRPHMGHRIGTKTFVVQELYDAMKERYNTTGDSGNLDDDFPEPSQSFQIVDKQAAQGAQRCSYEGKWAGDCEFATKVALACMNALYYVMHNIRPLGLRYRFVTLLDRAITLCYPYYYLYRLYYGRQC
jgi:hypothetical protein